MSSDAISPLRQRMIEDMSARKLNPHTQRSHIGGCKRFAAYLKRSPDTATADEIRLFQLQLTETGTSICNRNRIMTGLRFLFRVTLRRLDLAAEIFHIREPQKIPLVMSPDEAKRLLAMAGTLKVHVLLALGYGAGLRAGEVVRLKVGDIDSAQNIIRIVQAKGRKDRHVMLSPDTLDLLRQWWKVRPTRYDAGVAQEQRWLFPGRKPGKPMTTRHLNRLFHETAEAAVHQEGGDAACAAPQFCDPSARTWNRHSRDSGSPRSLQARHDGALHACGYRHDLCHREPTRLAVRAAQDGQEERPAAAAGLNGPRPYPVQLWRSRISSATSALPGVAPTRVM